MVETAKYSEQIFFTGSEYFSNLLNDLAHAKTSIDFETYIFNHDEIGWGVVAVLKEAAKKGVAIRLLVDGAGSPQWGGRYAGALEQAGVQTRIFHPFPWRFWQWSRAKINAPFVLKLIYLFLKINSRNHRKTCVIDDKIAYIGSFNICKNHLDRSQRGDGWRDTGVRLTGIDFSSLKEAFNAAWDSFPIKERIKAIFKHVHTDPVLRFNNTRHRRRILYKNLLRRIASCKERVWITNAYFVPDNFFLKKLENAAQKKVDVRILLPQKSDVLFMPWASHTFYELLLRAGIRIFEYLPTVMHAKTLILDDWMSIGSSNLNYRSLLHDLEVDVNIRCADSQKALQEQFLLDLKEAQEINLESWQKRPIWQRIMGQLLLYVRYWI